MIPSSPFEIILNNMKFLGVLVICSEPLGAYKSDRVLKGPTETLAGSLLNETKWILV